MKHTTHVFTNLPLISNESAHLPCHPESRIQIPQSMSNNTRTPARVPSLANEVKTKPQRVFSLALYSQTIGAGKRSHMARSREQESSGLWAEAGHLGFSMEATGRLRHIYTSDVQDILVRAVQQLLGCCR
jgi:hypothetical protein